MADLSISQVREKFPQYSDMSDEQLAQGLHKKYYRDMPFDAFSQKIGLKSKQETPYMAPAELKEQRKGYRARLAGVGEVTPETKGFEKPALEGGLGQQFLGVAEGAPLGLYSAVAGLPGVRRVLPSGEKVAEKVYKPVEEFFGVTDTPAKKSGRERGMMLGMGPFASPAMKAIGVGGTFIGDLLKVPYNLAKNTVVRSIGRDVTAAEEAAITKARQVAEGKAAELNAEEKSLLRSLEQEQARVEATTKAAEKAEAGEKAAVRGLAGTRTAEEFGQFTAIPQTKQEVGNYLRGIYENFVNSVKKVRSSKADEELKGSLSAAAEKEAAGQAFKDSSGMQDLFSFIEGKLAKETDPTLRSQLQVIKKALFGGEKGAFSAEEIAAEMARQPSSFSNEAKRRMALQVLEKKEVEQGIAPSFQSSETIRRKIGDAAFGVPEEGYAAIGQNLARDLYGKLSGSMKAFEPSFSDYLERYKRLSETIEASGTKLGKSLGAMEKDAQAYHATEASLLPDRAFRNGESVKTLIDALGGNKQPVMAAAERWVAGKIAEAGNAEKARKFLTSNQMREIRSVLGPEFEQRISQKYLQEATALSQQADRLRATIKASETAISDASEKLKKIGGQKETIESGIKAVESALNEADRQKAIAKLVTKLSTEVPAGQAQELNVMVQGIKDALDARSKARWLVAKGAGLVGAGSAYKYFGGGQ